jgi:hypothetical protein
VNVIRQIRSIDRIIELLSFPFQVRSLVGEVPMRFALLRLHGLAIISGIAGLLTLTAASALAWPTAHGDPANSNGVDVRTAPAINPMTSVPLRDIAPGVNPVIAPNGTLYIGNERGTLMSFSPDGTPGWSRDLGGFQSVRASAAIGSDGSVYVIGSAQIRDNTTDPASLKYVAELHRFTAGGGWLWHVPLGEPVPGLTYSPPNIVSRNGSDVILVAAGIRGAGAFLTAYSGESGVVLAHQKVAPFDPPQVTGGADLGWVDSLYTFLSCVASLQCDWSATVELEHQLPKNLTRPFPAVAVFAQTASGDPNVYVSDRNKDLVGYSFTGSSFIELFRVRDPKRTLTSAPLVWPNGPVMISTFGDNAGPEVLFLSLGPDYTGGPVTTHRIKSQISMAAPTALGNSRFALVNIFGGVTFLNGAAVQKQVMIPGGSIAPAAASRTHVFVSTVVGLHTFSKAKMEKVGEYTWTRGGASQPVIGPGGHVYAIAQNTLYVFPPSRIPDVPDVGSLPDITTGNPQPSPSPGAVLGESGAPAPLSSSETQPADVQSLPDVQASGSSKTYKPPRTAAGNRLLACLELDGDDCDKSQYRTVAESFCRNQGFQSAGDLDVDAKRGRAETLDGQLCTQKKCKVFDFIVCQR